MSKWLVSLDTDKIKKYIFASDKLKEIRGASGLLDFLNRTKIPELIEAFHGESIFVGGGSAMAVFGVKDDADEFSEAVKQMYISETGTATISSATVEYDPETSNVDGSFKNALSQANYLLQKDKADGQISYVITSQPLFSRCERCGLFPVEQIVNIGESDVAICHTCSMKQNTSAEYLPGRRLQKSEFASKEFQDAEFPFLIDELGEFSTPKNYIALVYADGNNIGKIIENHIHTEKDIQVFSKLLESAIESALIHTIESHWDQKSLKIPMIPIIIGGDDVMFLTSGHLGIEMASNLCVNFQTVFGELLADEMKEMPFLFNGNSPSVTMSAGVVIAKTSHPIFALDELGEQLLKTAKQLSKQLNSRYGLQPTIDFRVITTPTANSWQKIVEHEFKLSDEYCATCRPYPINRITEFQRPALEEVKTSIQHLKENQFPKNKIRSWRDILRNDLELQTQLDLNTFRTHLTQKQFEVVNHINQQLYLTKGLGLFLMDPLTPERNISPLPDLEEIYDFI